jgi:type IV pilus assembly protein PilB
MKKIINQNADYAELKAAAAASGMISLYDSALSKIKTGQSSPAEMMRVIDINH